MISPLILHTLSTSLFLCLRLLRGSWLGFFHIEQGDENAGEEHQRGARHGERIDGLLENENPRKYPRDGLKGAEDGGPASADEKRAPLEQGDSPRVHDPGKADAQKPPRRGLGKGELLCEEADEKQKDRCDGRHAKAEAEDRALFMLVGRQRHDVNGVRHAGGEGVQAALQIEGGARVVEQGNARHADHNAEDVLDLPPPFAEQKLAKHHHGGVYEVEHRGRAGLNVAVGAEEQEGSQATAHDGDKAHGGKGLGAHTDPAAAAEGQGGQHGQGEQVAQKRQRHGVDPVGVNIAGHQGHQTENDRAEYDEPVALQNLFVFHKHHLP